MCKTIKQKVKFKTDPETLYELLSNSEMHSRITGQKAVISEKIGGSFETLSGKVTGINVDLLRGKRIVQAWRRSDFPAGIFSMAAVTFEKTTDGGTQLVLTHRGVPKDLIAGIEDSWRNHYWKRIKSYLDEQDPN